MYSSIQITLHKKCVMLTPAAANYKQVICPNFDCPFCPFCPMGIKEKPLKAQSSISALGGFIQIENNNLSFIFL